jgi:hypothetical protein
MPVFDQQIGRRYNPPIRHSQDRGVIASGDFQPVIGGQKLANSGNQPELAQVRDGNCSTSSICRDVAVGPAAWSLCLAGQRSQQIPTVALP